MIIIPNEKYHFVQIPVPNVTDLVERQAEEGRSEEVDEEREERLKEVLREVEELKDEVLNIICRQIFVFK